MKRKNANNKVHRNFKISPKLDKALRREAGKVGSTKTQTDIVEAALAQWFLIKR
jgi:hypothetical protein